MRTVFTTSDIAVEAVERTAAIGIDGVVVQKPGVTPFGFVEDGFCLDKLWHGPWNILATSSACNYLYAEN